MYRWESKETRTTNTSYILVERGGDMEIDMKRVIVILISLLEEQEGIKIDYSFEKNFEKNEEAVGYRRETA